MAATGWRVGLLLTLVTVGMWSVLPHFLQAGLHFIDPLTLNFFRFVAAGVALGTILAVRGEVPKASQFHGKVWPLLLIAIFGLASNYAFYLWGIGRVSASAGQILIQLAPALLTLGSILFFKERFTGPQIGGFIVLLLGLLVFFNHRWSSVTLAVDEYAWGIGSILLAALTWVAYALSQKKLLEAFTSSQIMVIIYLGAGLLFLPLVDFSQFIALSVGEWTILLWCALNTLIGYGAFAEAMRHWDASRVSAVLALTPLGTLAVSEVVEVAWPGAFLHESINALSLVGAAAVVGGSLTVALWRQPRIS